MAAQTLSADVINAAIEGFEFQKRKIDEQIGELRRLLSPVSVAHAAAGKPRRKMSAAGRRAIAEAQRKRWAATKTKGQAGGASAAKPKRRLSAAGRKRIIEATKKRWALVREQKKAAAKAAGKD